jgi:hypothetical protein
LALCQFFTHPTTDEMVEATGILGCGWRSNTVIKNIIMLPGAMDNPIPTLPQFTRRVQNAQQLPLALSSMSK